MNPLFLVTLVPALFSFLAGGKSVAVLWLSSGLLFQFLHSILPLKNRIFAGTPLWKIVTSSLFFIGGLPLFLKMNTERAPSWKPWLLLSEQETNFLFFLLTYVFVVMLFFISVYMWRQRE